ncbi:MAG: AAA family ATPase [Gemmatimonadota bacterium]
MPDSSAGPTPTSLEPLELVAIGAPTARLGGRPAPSDVLWRKHLALLIYLARSPNRTRSRSHLIALLWPDKVESRARHSLNEALHRLRSALGSGRLIVQGDSVTLSEDGLSIDVESPPSPEGRESESEFMEGFALPDAPGFEEWADAERPRWRARVVNVALGVGGRALDGGAHLTAAEIARSILSRDPLSEPGEKLLIRALALSGDCAGALHAFHLFSVRLEELAERPSRDLSALAVRIRTDSPPGRALTREPGLAPLSGREAPLRAAAALLADTFAGRAALILVQGRPGMGRTRFLAECESRLVLDGAVVAHVRPVEGDQSVAWSTLRALVRRGLLNAPGLPGMTPFDLSLLAGIVPELKARAVPRDALDQGEVASAFAALLTAIAEEAPVALIIDDANLADSATLSALGAALTQLQQTPVSVILAPVADDPEKPRELLHLEAQVGRSLRGALITLRPLEHAAILAVVEAMAPWCEDETERDRLARRLAFETGGSPLFLVTLLQGLLDVASLREHLVAWPRASETLETPLPMEVPGMVRLAILAQAARLDREAMMVLRAASVAGAVIDDALLSAMTGVSRAGLVTPMAALERRHFLRLEDGRYAFVSPVLAGVIARECLTGSEIRELRGRALAGLAGREDLESRIASGELRSAVEPGLPAFDLCLGLAHEAAGLRLARLARRALVAAERSISEVEEGRRAELERLRSELGLAAAPPG